MLKRLRMKRSKKGFTLVELIVVIAILGILMLIAVPRFAGFRENAAIKADEATGATIGKSAELYVANGYEEELNIGTLKSRELIENKDYKAQSDHYEGDFIVLEDKDGVKVTAGAHPIYPVTTPKEITP